MATTSTPRHSLIKPDMSETVDDTILVHNPATLDIIDAALVEQGLFSERPAAGNAGHLFLARDSGLLYRDNGASWDTIAGHREGTFAARPAAAFAGRLYIATDLGKGAIYRDNGVSWDLLNTVLLHADVTSDGTPAALGEVLLKTYTLPAGVLETDGMGLEIEAWGQLTIAGSDAITTRIAFGGVDLSDSTTYNTSGFKSYRTLIRLTRTGASNGDVLAKTEINFRSNWNGNTTGVVSEASIAVGLSVARDIEHFGENVSVAAANQVTSHGLFVKLVPAP